MDLHEIRDRALLRGDLETVRWVDQQWAIMAMRRAAK
jgi:hypothetical protein